MKTLSFVFVSFLIGFLTAIPIGATQIEIAKRSMAGKVRSALMVVLGSVASDVMYGFVAIFGIAPFLMDRNVENFFWFIAGVILFLLGLFTLFYGGNSRENSVNATLFSKKASLAIGFSLAVTNPPIIFWWIFCFEFIKRVDILPKNTLLYSILFVVFCGLGILSYLSSLALFIAKAGKAISIEMERKINKIMGILLIILSIYFLFKATGMLTRISL